MVVAALQGVDQHSRSSFGGSGSQGHFDMQTRGIKPATFR